MFYGILIFTATIAILVVFGAIRFLGRERRLIKKLNHLEARGDISEGILVIKDYIKINPRDADMYMKLVDFYLLKKNPAMALSILKNMRQKVLISDKVRPINIEKRIGVIEFNAKMLHDAFIHLNKFVSKYSNDAEAHILIGRIYGSQHKLENAIHEFTVAKDIDPKNSDAFFYMGLALLDFGKADRAEKELKNAISIRKKHIKARYFLGLLYRSRGKNDLAEKFLSHIPKDKVNAVPLAIERIGILSQNMPKIKDFDKLIEDVKNNNAVLSEQNNKKKFSFEDIFTLPSQEFHSFSLKILSKMGFQNHKLIRNQLFDPAIELNFFCQKNGTNIIAHINREKKEIGEVLTRNFIDLIAEKKTGKAVFITTSSLNKKASAILNEKSVIVIDKKKLVHYIRS